MSRFRKQYRQLTSIEANLIESIKFKAEQLEEELLELADSREKSLALTKLEECVMWAVKKVTE